MKYLTHKEIIENHKYKLYLNANKIIQDELYHVTWGESKSVVGKVDKILNPLLCTMKSPKSNKKWIYPVKLTDMYYTQRTTVMLYMIRHILKQDPDYIENKIGDQTIALKVHNNQKRYKPQAWSSKEWLWYKLQFT